MTGFKVMKQGAYAKHDWFNAIALRLHACLNCRWHYLDRTKVLLRMTAFVRIGLSTVVSC